MYLDKRAILPICLIVATWILLGILAFGCGSAKAAEYTIVPATETTPEMQCMSNWQFEPNPNYRDPMRNPLSVLGSLARVAAPVVAAQSAPIAMRAASGGVSSGIDAADKLVKPEGETNTTDRELNVNHPICHDTGRTLASIAADKQANEAVHASRMSNTGHDITKAEAEALMANPRMWHPLSPGGWLGVWTGIDGRQYAGSKGDWDFYQASIGYK